LKGSGWRPGDPPTSDWATVSTPEWFWSHYGEAAATIIDFLAADGHMLAGRDVADVGCGDGIIDLGLVHRAEPARLVGYDVDPTVGDLLERARAAGVADELPPNLTFVRSESTHVPAPDESFDVVVTWSTFEHVEDPVGLLREIERILKPDGVLFLQLWPFYYSEHGAHLWHWYPGGFAHLRQSEEQLQADVRSRDGHLPGTAEEALRIFRTLNRITLDELHGALREAGFVVSKVEVMSHEVHVPPELEDHPLSELAIAGVKLLASRRRDRPARPAA
jgi:SAM-dependent methyltransferase